LIPLPKTIGAFRCGKQGLKLEGDVDEMLGSTVELKKKAQDID
jgi:hypothetical protein